MATDDPVTREQEFLTTREVAAYLRLKERRIYELVRQGAIPCTRVTGKWLFPRTLIDLWLAENVEGETTQRPPAVIAGSQDPLLDWAVMEAGCGLALLPGGSLDGLRRFAAREAVAAGLHLLDPRGGDYNVAALAANLAEPSFARQGLVLLEWARRRQGLIVGAGNPHGVQRLADLQEKALRVILRQEDAGSHLLFTHLLDESGLTVDALTITQETARSETEVGLAILEGRAEAGLGVEAVARTLKLGFVPLVQERYDLLMRRRDFFEPPLQSLFAFARTPAFTARAKQMGGYDVGGLGTVRYNGP